MVKKEKNWLKEGGIVSKEVANRIRFCIDTVIPLSRTKEFENMNKEIDFSQYKIEDIDSVMEKCKKILFEKLDSKRHKYRLKYILIGDVK